MYQFELVCANWNAQFQYEESEGSDNYPIPTPMSNPVSTGMGTKSGSSGNGVLVYIVFMFFLINS